MFLSLQKCDIVFLADEKKKKSSSEMFISCAAVWINIEIAGDSSGIKASSACLLFPHEWD